MSDWKTELESLGVNITETMQRFMNNEDLYLRILRKFPADTSFASAVQAKDAGDDENAEMHIHTLKGVSSNLGLTPITEITAEMMQEFRKGQAKNAYARFDELSRKCTEFVNIIQQL